MTPTELSEGGSRRPQGGGSLLDTATKLVTVGRRPLTGNYTGGILALAAGGTRQ